MLQKSSLFNMVTSSCTRKRRFVCMRLVSYQIRDVVAMTRGVVWK